MGKEFFSRAVMSAILSFFGNKCTEKGSEEVDGSCTSSLPMWNHRLELIKCTMYKYMVIFSFCEKYIYIYSYMYFSQKETIIYLSVNKQKTLLLDIQ